MSDMTSRLGNNRSALDWLFIKNAQGHIVPPDFSIGTSSEENIREMAQIVWVRTGENLQVPTRGNSLAGLERIGRMHAHESRLAKALAGDIPTQEGVALHELFLAGAPISITPLYLEGQLIRTFTPVIQRSSPNSDIFLLGDSSGRTKQYSIRLRNHLHRTVTLMISEAHRWIQDEHDTRQQWLKSQTKGMAHNPHTLIWSETMRKKGAFEVDEGRMYRMEKWGTHGLYLYMAVGRGYVPLEASSESLAARYAWALATSGGIDLPKQYAPSKFLSFLGVRELTQTSQSSLCVKGKYGELVVSIGQRGALSAADMRGDMVQVTLGGKKITTIRNGKEVRGLSWVEDDDEWRNQANLARVTAGWLYTVLRGVSV